MRRHCFIALFAVACARAACADDASPLRIVLVRSEPSALILWNATPQVGALVSKRASDRAANDALERGALRAADAELHALARAKTIDVRILYDKTGEISPVYGNATFAGVERYALLELDGPHARSDADHWRELRARDPIPTWVRFRVLGALPQR